MAPDRKQGDVVQTTISHTRTKVVVRIRMRALPRDDWEAFSVIRTPRATFQAHPGSSTATPGTSGSSRARAFVGPGAPRSPRGSTAPHWCSRWRADCLGNPRWIRAGAGIASYDGSALSDDDEGVTGYGDDALRRSIGEDVRLSPRLRRG
ncbi:hypothetical protein G5V59_01545 [Nocardioides sp. W3-2-3]|uniref:hypothetical protein n=1 Tax=Nocardioides convexus TaxID=2712224 RepID=UPI0024183D24|nr:hypothetical protein [Nocardioides convexus]NGZ99529.1 hypothetical protein [Nocardioides convexus]